MARPFRRRQFLAGAAAFTLLGNGKAVAQLQPAQPPPAERAPSGQGTFSLETVRDLAREAAGRDYEAPDESLPDYLSDIGYDEYRDIRFRPDQALWRDENLPFEVQFFHRGFLYKPRVDVAVVAFGEVQPLKFDPAQFHYGNTVFPEPVPPDLGYAGFRLHYPLNRPDYRDEVAVFLGASYFRVLGAGQVYGASARGLAIDTALPSGEEFPLFRRFWIERPAPGASFIRLWALLDSPSVVGRVPVHPAARRCFGDGHRLRDLRSRGHRQSRPRAADQHVLLRRIGPAAHGRDYRPEVHDSDGLLVAASPEEWRWRPLNNPSSLQITTLPLTNPRGFGLLQRDREFANYQDLESRFELRPSLWVEPKGDWGEGVVELIEIPTKSEANDKSSPPGSPRVVAGRATSRPLPIDALPSWARPAPAAGRAVATRLEPAQSRLRRTPCA